MQITAIKTHRIEVGESLEDLIDQYIESLRENDIVVVTSKIISLCQGRVVPKNSITMEDLLNDYRRLPVGSSSV